MRLHGRRGGRPHARTSAVGTVRQRPGPVEEPGDEGQVAGVVAWIEVRAVPGGGASLSAAEDVAHLLCGGGEMVEVAADPGHLPELLKLRESIGQRRGLGVRLSKKVLVAVEEPTPDPGPAAAAADALGGIHADLKGLGQRHDTGLRGPETLGVHRQRRASEKLERTVILLDIPDGDCSCDCTRSFSLSAATSCVRASLDTTNSAGSESASLPDLALNLLRGNRR